MVWCGTDGIISAVHPARPIRSAASTLLVLLALLAASPTLAGGQAADPFGRRPQRAPRTEAPKKAADKTPPLSVRTEWTVDLPAAPSGPPAYDADRAYLPLDFGDVAAVALVNGKVAWTVAAHPAGTLAAGDELVFVPLAGAIEAREAATGSVRWRAAVEGKLSAALVWQNGWLVVPTDRGGVVMLRAADGQRLWAQDLPAPVRTRAKLTGDRIYVGLENGEVRALRLETGAPIWTRALKARPTTLAPLDDRVFVGGDDKFLYCLSAKNGKQNWRWRTGGAIVGTPVFDKDNVYFLSLDNVLRALDRGDGHQVWHAGLTFRPLDGPYLADKRLVVAGLSQLHAFRAGDGTEAGEVDAGGVIAAAPHFLPPDEEGVQPFVLFTREGQMARMAPAPPPLPSKPFPEKMIYPLWPGTEEGKTETAKQEKAQGLGLRA
jgi:outer membrane protein assembly factor BamB